MCVCVCVCVCGVCVRLCVCECVCVSVAGKYKSDTDEIPAPNNRVNRAPRFVRMTDVCIRIQMYKCHTMCIEYMSLCRI